jgi:hypothetical protein
MTEGFTGRWPIFPFEPSHKTPNCVVLLLEQRSFAKQRNGISSITFSERP